jgi:hypothetical protein
MLDIPDETRKKLEHIMMCSTPMNFKPEFILNGHNQNAVTWENFLFPNIPQIILDLE